MAAGVFIQATPAWDQTVPGAVVLNTQHSTLLGLNKGRQSEICVWEIFQENKISFHKQEHGKERGSKKGEEDEED